MSRVRQFLLSLLALGLLCPAFAASTATQPQDKPAASSAAKAQALFADPDHLLPAGTASAAEFSLRLAAFAEASGLKLHVQLRSKFTPNTPGQRPGNVAAGIGRELHLTGDEILAVYFADIDKWGLWIGDHHVNHFVGRPGTVKALTKDGTFHQAKLTFLTAAQARGVQLASDAAQTGPVSDAQKIHFQVLALIEAFITKFTSAPSPAPAPTATP